MTALTIAGNSHTGALVRGGAMVPEAKDVTFFPFGAGVYETAPFSAIRQGRVVLTQPVYAENLQKHTGLNHIDPKRLWGFCMGTHNVRLYRDAIWTGSAAPANLATADQRPVSSGMLDRMADDDQRHIRVFFTQLKKVGIRFFVISAPPVRADFPSIQNGASHDVLLEIDARSRARFRAFLDDLGVDFIDFPAESVDERGLLRSELAAGMLKSGRRDRHHGNTEYGVMMMRKIMSEVGRLDV